MAVSSLLLGTEAHPGFVHSTHSPEPETAGDVSTSTLRRASEPSNCRVTDARPI